MRANEKVGRPNGIKKSPSLSIQGKTVLNMKGLRQKYGLSQATFARMLGIAEATLARWEKGECSLRVSDRAKFSRVKKIVERAARSMRRTYVAKWIKQASPACAEIGATAPIDLMERGDYEAVEDLLFYLGSGVPT